MRRKQGFDRWQPDARPVSRASAAAVNRLARRQHGIVTRRQLIDLGLDPRAIDRRVEAQRLIRIHRGVYRMGPLAQPLEREMAAVLAAGPRAVVSHTSAARLHQIAAPASGGAVEITTPGRHPAPSSRIRVHRTSALPADETAVHHRIPVTTPARTLLDLAATLNRGSLEQAVAQMHRRRLATPESLRILLARYPRRPGTPALRALVDGPLRPAFTRSRAERAFLNLVRRAGLPEPDVNSEVGGYEVDFFWPAHRLAVEIDGYPFHSARPDRRRDHARDADLAGLGISVLRLDPEQVRERPEATVALLARATR